MPAPYVYQPALTGASLDAALSTTLGTRRALIEGLLYQHSVLLISADAGTGKSTLIANIMAQASLGLPVFQVLTVPRPLLCYYIPFERGSEEIRERLCHMRKTIPFNSDNICLFENSTFSAPNLYDRADQDFLLASIAKDCAARPPDVVIYDPIYQAVAGGLCNEDRVSTFIRFNVRLMAEFGCATWLNHHTGKPQYGSDGEAIEKDDPYYGSSYLRNHCTGSYYLKRHAESDGTILLRKKDNLDLLLKKIVLHYDPETYTSYCKDVSQDVSVSDRLRIALRQYKSTGQKFTFRQLEGCLMGVSTSYLRSLFQTPPFRDIVKKTTARGCATYYEIDGDI